MAEVGSVLLDVCLECKEMHEYACEFEVRDGNGPPGVAAGAELIAYGLWPLFEPYERFDVACSAEPHAPYAPFGCVDEASVAWCVFYELPDVGWTCGCLVDEG